MIKTLISIFISISIAAETQISGVTGSDYPPFTTSKKEGGGKAVKLVRDVFKTMKVPMKLSWMPWKRAEEKTKQGKFHFIFPYVKNSVREKHFLFSNPLYKIKTYIYVRKNLNQSTIDSFFIENKKTCWPVGYNIEDLQYYVDKYHLQIIRPTTMKKCFIMLSKGHVDSVHSNNYLASSLMQKLELNNIRALSKELSKKTLHIMFPKKLKSSKDLVKKFNRVLKRVTDLSL